MGNKILFVGDIHGRPRWKAPVAEALLKFQDIVFLGDYVDSFDIRPVEILHNLKEIIRYKKKYPDRITLLLGNHDYAYIDDHSQTSGFNFHMYQTYKNVFESNKELFQVAWGYTNPTTHRYTLATHAGITKTYYDRFIKTNIDNADSRLNTLSGGDASRLKLHEILNFMRDDKNLWKVGSMRGGVGTPGPLWADYLELLEDRYDGINQVFGHTAAGTVSIDLFGEDLVAKIDSNMPKSQPHLLISL